MEQGQPAFTVTDLLAGVRWMLPMSSTARDLIVTGPWLAVVVHAICQLVRPVAGRHVVPPSTDTSTPATTPPPVSEAVPAIVTVVPPGTGRRSTGW